MLNQIDECVPRPSKTLSIAQEIQQKDESLTFKLTFNAFSCLKKIDYLEKIFLKDLYVNKVHFGKYLICRVVKEAFYSDETCRFIIQDELDEIENVFLSDLIPVKKFSINSIFIIKEPCLFMKDKKCYIKIDSPSDMQTIFNHNIIKWHSKEIFLTVNELNLLGNQSYSNKDFESAVKFYTWALDKSLDKSLDAKILGNRAAAYLNLEYFNQSSKDCKASIKLNSKNEKAFFRLAKCFYKMRQFNLAFDALDKCFNLDSKNSDILRELNHSKKRLNEAKTGDFQFKELIDACRDNVLRHDIADFISDKIYLDKEQCLFKAKTGIKRGTLLICEKAASIWYKVENTESKSNDLKHQNYRQLIRRLEHDPFLLKEVYGIVGKDSHDLTEHENIFIDVAEIKGIIDENSFQSRPMEFCNNFKPEPNKLDSNSGFWTKCAFIKHSCFPNAHKIYLNDVVLVYASQDIFENEPITSSYINNTDTFEERSKNLKEYGIDKCICDLCNMDREDMLAKDRESFILENRDRIRKLVDQDSKDVNTGLVYFDKIKEMYKNRASAHRLCLAPALLFCASLFRNKGKLDKSAKTFMDMFELCKDFNYDMAVFGIVEAINDYYLWFNIENAKECFKKWKDYSIGHHEYFIHVCDAKIIDYENIYQLLD